MTLAPLTRALVAPALGAVLVATGIAATPADGATRRAPHHLKLPDGFQPTGIAIRGGPQAFVASIQGGIYAANLRTGKGRLISGGDGTQAIGLALGTGGRLWVAGGDDGVASVFNVRTGRVVAHYGLTDGRSAVSDVVLRGGSAWFTDSARGVLYQVTPGRGQAVPPKVRTVVLGGSWGNLPDGGQASGISTSPDGRALLVMQTATGHLFRVDPSTGSASRVGLGSTILSGGLGLLRAGRLLYVVQDPRQRVAVIRLGKHGSSGRLLHTRTAPDVDWPTSVARYRGALYVSNGREMSAPTPTTKYWISRLRR